MNVSMAPAPMPAAPTAPAGAPMGAATPVVDPTTTGDDRPARDESGDEQPDDFTAIIATVARTVVAAVDQATAQAGSGPAAGTTADSGTVGAIAAIGDGSAEDGSPYGWAHGRAGMVPVGRGLGHAMAADAARPGLGHGLAAGPQVAAMALAHAAGTAPGLAQAPGGGLAGQMADGATTPGLPVDGMVVDGVMVEGIEGDVAITGPIVDGGEDAMPATALAATAAEAEAASTDADGSPATTAASAAQTAEMDDTAEATPRRPTVGEADEVAEVGEVADGDEAELRPVTPASERARPGAPGRAGTAPGAETAAARATADRVLADEAAAAEAAAAARGDASLRGQTAADRRAEPFAEGARPTPAANPPAAVPGTAGTTPHVPIAEAVAVTASPGAAGPTELAAMEGLGSTRRSTTPLPHVAGVTGAQQLTIDASDDTLGKLTITASTERGAVNLHLVAEEDRTRSALEQQQSELRDELEAAGVPLGNLDVSDGRDDADRADQERSDDSGAIARTGDDPRTDGPAGPAGDRIDGHLDLHL